MNSYETWGTVDITLNPGDASASKQLIEQALGRATLVTNALSLLYGASLRWFPARYLRVLRTVASPPPEREETENWECVPLARSQEEQTSVVLRDENISSELFLLVNKLEAVPKDVQGVIKTAIDWHTQANYYPAGLNRYVNYWTSIELLGHFFHKRFDKGKSKGERKAEIFKKLRDVTKKSCAKVVKDCAEILDPSVKTKISTFLDIIIADRDRLALLKDGLFRKDDKSKKSLYEIRNDIAHGNFSEHDHELVEKVRHKLFDAKLISREILLSTIAWAEKMPDKERFQPSLSE
jgi:hypothetical protein